ncbi:MAG: hypothetical protein E5V49_09800 [Mesorhizobium sp.]|nr:hypothetical protein EN848_05705 [bacterium M00.F.Ca.ET.205.01.1.1]TGU53579.1 hypothetical protein EN795_10120 [bacterium M00.F.Ca.ET.152.01.1.1]TGV37081.1 hypothetical protein EN829_010145 [Mesorhizobium sp. M00.F.Ca.ET.186.01.1.1]TGZ41493.1 hypothetical protein EN805_18305 [bacterium M00.F.Ca.ET.162.01.1.1]TIW60751.1 MAG: hypothetical protein E5V48_12150 [Mesorhizobium sp.]
MLNRDLYALPAFIIFLCILICPDIARADYSTPHAEVVCQPGHNVALVRFTMTADEEPIVYRQLPTSADQGLSAAPTLGQSNCTMANGWTLRLRDGQKQAFGYGMGGGDPPAFFSLWIAKRKILSRKQWKSGFGVDEAPWLIGLVIRPDRLSYCYAAHSYAAPDNGVITCRDEAFQLIRHEIDRVEYGTSGRRPPVGTILLARGTSEPRLCRKLLRLRPKGFQGVGTTVNDTANVFPVETAGQDINIATVEVSPGVRRKLVRWSGINHYFDGDLMLLAPVTADPSKILKESMLDDDGDKFPADKLPSGWSVIAGSMPGLYPDVSWRYVHFDTQWIDGKLYLLAQATNLQQRPTAILVQPLANGFKSVCVFQRVEPNF